MEIKKKLIRVLKLRVARAIFFAILNGQSLTLMIKNKKKEEFILTTNKGVEILLFEASSCNTAEANAISALRDLSIEMGNHISKENIEKIIKIN